MFGTVVKRKQNAHTKSEINVFVFVFWNYNIFVREQNGGCSDNEVGFNYM